MKEIEDYWEKRSFRPYRILAQSKRTYLLKEEKNLIKNTPFLAIKFAGMWEEEV